MRRMSWSTTRSPQPTSARIRISVSQEDLALCVIESRTRLIEQEERGIRCRAHAQPRADVPHRVGASATGRCDRSASPTRARAVIAISRAWLREELTNGDGGGFDILQNSQLLEQARDLERARDPDMGETVGGNR